MIFGRDFNVFFDTNYKSVAKLSHIRESLELCYIWRVRNLRKKQFTFRQRHNTGFIQKRLDYFLV